MNRPQAVVRRAAAAVDSFTTSPGRVVLIYHRVGRRTNVSVDLPSNEFDWQISWISRCADPMSIAEAFPACSPPSHATVTVTFDDGTGDFVDEALPILVEHGVPATLYLATDFIESQRMFPDDGVPLSWAGAAEALSTGLVTIGSHSHTHCLFDRITPQEAADDLDRSIDLIGERLGVRAEHFAYPKALLASPAVEPEVRKRFKTAAIARTRPNRPGKTDLHRLTRSPIQVSDGMKYFEKKVNGGMWLENDVRDLVNKWRYRGATQ